MKPTTPSCTTLCQWRNLGVTLNMDMSWTKWNRLEDGDGWSQTKSDPIATGEPPLPSNFFGL
jgi:hypothetical protein